MRSIVRPIQQSRAIRNEEREIFILTATLLWGIIIQETIAYLYTNNAKSVLPVVDGVVDNLGHQDADWVCSPRGHAGTAIVPVMAAGKSHRAGKAV